MRFILPFLLIGCVSAHEMVPTYPKLTPSMPGLLKTEMEMFNKRADVSFYEIGVFDKDWNPIPFVTSYKLLKIKYLGHVKFDVYIRENDVERAEYICSRSKLRNTAEKETLVSSKICSRFK